MEQVYILKPITRMNGTVKAIMETNCPMVLISTSLSFQTLKPKQVGFTAIDRAKTNYLFLLRYDPDAPTIGKGRRHQILP